jgi:hypothetical protein
MTLKWMPKGETEMATAPAKPLWTADHLLTAVKHLPPAELREFQRQFAAWFGQNNRPSSESSTPASEEALAAIIRENTTLPAREQRQFNRLRRKRQTGALTDAEEQQLQDLWRQVEQMNAVHLEALGELARRRGMDVRTLMDQLGLPENCDVF